MENINKNDDANLDGNKERSFKVVEVLKNFLDIQKRRAEAYSKLQRGFSDYMVNRGELIYQNLCREITEEFNSCSKHVREMETTLANLDSSHGNLVEILKGVQEQEKQKLRLTVQIQMLKKAGRPSEQIVRHDDCPRGPSHEHECIHIHQLSEADGVEDAEIDAAYDDAMKNAIIGVQETVTCINEYLEDVRYEIEAFEGDIHENELLERSVMAMNIR